MSVVNYLKKVQLPNNVEYTVKDPTFFTGTTEEWNLLSTEEKQSYQIVNLTDDEEEGDISEKADKVIGATAGNLAGLDSNGNLTDSGWNGAKDTTSISGNPISISGLKSNQLAVNPIITFEPIQAGSGTPSPSNVRAISGYDKIEVLSCGKNLNDESTRTKQIITDTGEVQNNASENLYDYICISGSKNYVISAKNTDSSTKRLRISYFDASKTFIVRKFTDISANTTGTYDVKSDTVLFSIPSGCKYIRINHADGISEIMFYEGSSIIAYEPYHKTTDLSESLGQTVYGATWYPRTGKFTVMFGIVDLGDLTWSYDTQYQRFMALVLNIKQRGARELPFVCSCYECISDSREVYDVPNYAIYSSVAYVYIHDSRYTDATAFKTAVTGQKIAYPVATPFEIQLTPHEISLLKDYAYVSTNGTNIALDYHNGELASLSDVSQLSETVALLDRPQERKTIVNITSYNTSSNRYSCEFDGYITALIPSGTGYVRVTIYDDLSQTMGISQRYAKSDGDEYYAVFVKKGMKAMVTASSGISPTVTFRGMA